MPRQNRVDPFGRIVAHPARGLLMGNRGCLHDEEGRIVRSSARPSWITCLPSWPGVRRILMQPGHYTELFFLDEVTAMAAGHRPCGCCRPEALAAFKAAWQRAFGLARSPRVSEIDEVLRSSGPGNVECVDIETDGIMVAINSNAHLLWRGEQLLWSDRGYKQAQIESLCATQLLTPAPLRAVLRNGYVPVIHHSAVVAPCSTEAWPVSARVANSLFPSAGGWCAVGR